MSGRDDESCNIMRHHATSCDRERKRVGSGWRKMSFDRRRCGRETRWRERERKAGGSRKQKQKTGGRRKPLTEAPKTSKTRQKEESTSKNTPTRVSNHLHLVLNMSTTDLPHARHHKDDSHCHTVNCPPSLRYHRVMLWKRVDQSWV